MVIFDTSFLIDVLLGNKKVVRAMGDYRGKEEVGITVITKYELLRCRKGLNLETARLLVDSMNIYYFREPEMEKAIGIYETLKAKGKMINELDIMIAGIAEANSQTLVATDGDFRAIDGDMIRVV